MSDAMRAILPTREVVREALGVLFFRAPSRRVADEWARFLSFGLGVTWLAGIGRYWDNPRAEWWQWLGLGSVAYVFVLAALLWVLVTPLRPARWSYRSVLVFVTLTSPPALLYAIPVERYMSLQAAQSANAWFLGVVALWRLALLFWFLRRVAGLAGDAVTVGTLFPMTVVIVTLSALNLERAVFEFMAGLRRTEVPGTAADSAFAIVTLLSILSVPLFPLLGVYWLWLVAKARRRRE